MMASEFIKKLQEMVEEHGDHPIVSRGEDGELNLANNAPSVFFEPDIFDDSKEYGADERLHYLDGFVIS